jgi:hypothetical protein
MNDNATRAAGSSAPAGSAFRDLAYEWLNTIDPNRHDISSYMKIQREVYKQCAKELLALATTMWPNVAVSGPAIAGTLDRPCSTGGQHGND